MLISVVTPAFNSLATLDRAYESVRKQDIADWEYIIVDDGSTDNTAARIRTIAARDARVKAVFTENKGPGAALNRGIQRSSGTWIAFLDADDEYLPGHLRKRLELTRRDPSVDISWGGVEVVVRHAGDAFVPDMVRGSGLIHASECVVQGTLFVRRTVFHQFQFTENRDIWYQDLDFVRRASTVHKTAKIDDVTYRYYRDSGSSLVDRAKAAIAR